HLFLLQRAGESAPGRRPNTLIQARRGRATIFQPLQLNVWMNAGSPKRRCEPANRDAQKNARYDIAHEMKIADNQGNSSDKGKQDIERSVFRVTRPKHGYDGTGRRDVSRRESRVCWPAMERVEAVHPVTNK